MANLKLEGVDNLAKELQKLNQKGKRIENKALKSAGNVVEKAIKEETPTDSGSLKDSIFTSNIKTKEGIKHVEVGPDKDGWYGAFIEFGTVNITANPFMGRGYEKSKEQAETEIANELKRGLGL
ncbi:HK97-gp10 family putative phage morphogenesis protein [Proteinivorax tanatarense]|uniref:HK97-gp10 family putative phage morphogenesis protein n=1 Tax=Proteinivorax tanatarense TaxID=1260629 RepID=A0AAU7VIA1_9FIRM